ncbi:hypothetical protein [Vitiosangium sp. GDMCC 1.1324]|uniref:hypothetical protein n=1 Tax=Vitiosangium sp. (strain GDMCC 1.1324) TaxID=2138576 RepID=UPI000D351346|nr:hypothetical protein [Vitiosangium sp. GDMCC 1.1324]PTL82289.1 hypothetical protein DAT35_21115 [Vitiosangium sp. GDMCC 1.1324]
MSLEVLLDDLHARVAASPWLRRFTAFTRGLLAIGFIRPGLIKALGGRFTEQSVETPIGYFFDAMYRTGGYWRFIGISQVLAGLLLLMPRSGPTVGALLFLPIILNIFVITVSVGFDGTWLVTGLMLLAVLYLVCWDYPRWKGVLFEPSPVRSVPPASEPVPWVLTLVTALGIQGLMGMMMGLKGGRLPLQYLAMLVLAAGLPLVQLARRSARVRTG